MLVRSFLLMLGLTMGLTGATTTESRAATLNFNFSFTNVSFNDEVITGVVSGLTDNALSSATSVQILSNTGNFGIGEYVNLPLSNNWSVSNGMIVAVNFESSGDTNGLGADLFFTGPVGSDQIIRAGLDPVSGGSLAASPDAGLSFTPAVSVVPIPASLPLLATAFAGLAAIARMRRRPSLQRANS